MRCMEDGTSRAPIKRRGGMPLTMASCIEAARERQGTGGAVDDSRGIRWSYWQVRPFFNLSMYIVCDREQRQ